VPSIGRARNAFTLSSIPPHSRNRHEPSYPSPTPDRPPSGSNLATARAAFGAAWLRLLPKVTKADLAEHRRERAWNEWKQRMWACGCKPPTQETTGPSRCFYGTEIDKQGPRACLCRAPGLPVNGEPVEPRRHTQAMRIAAIAVRRR
jgi:hypothetical protein